MIHENKTASGYLWKEKNPHRILANSSTIHTINNLG